MILSWRFPYFTDIVQILNFLSIREYFLEDIPFQIMLYKRCISIIIQKIKKIQL